MIATDDAPRRSGRAAAMPPEERRAAIIAATLPLVLQHGAAVTTRQIAESAEIAEGTIFRVFPDKDTLIRAVIEAALDPSAAEASIGRIDRSMDLEHRLTAAVEIIQRRLNDIWRLFSAVGHDNLAKGGERRRPPDLRGLDDLFEPEIERRTTGSRSPARILYGMTLAMSHPMLIADEPAAPQDIVAILLDGIRTSKDHTSTPHLTTEAPDLTTDTESTC